MNTASAHPAALPISTQHAGPHLGALAIVFTVLFNAGLYFVTDLAGKPHFPSPLEPAADVVAYFRTRASSALICAFLQFGAAVPLGIFTATVVSRLRFLGVRAAGATIALFGGLAASFDMTASSLITWTLAQPGIADDGTLVRALHYLLFAFGGPGYSVPLGLLLAGVSVTAGFRRLLPRWIVVLGIGLGAIGELSWLSLIVPRALFLIPLTRFPAFVWLIAAGFALPKTVPARV